MKKITLAITLLLLSSTSLSGEWIAVDGGVREIDLREKEVEDNLWIYLANISEFQFQPRDRYTYQYQVKSEDELFINAFCESFGKTNLNEEFLEVMDGGPCFFQATMNLKTGKFILIYVNGLA